MCGKASSCRNFALAASQFDEVPRVEREQGERHDFQGREHRPQRHRDGHLAGPVPVVSRADDAAAQVEDGVEIDHARRSLVRHHAQPEEDHRHHDGDEQFKEAFDPKVNDPEPPRINHGEVGFAGEEHRRQIKERDADGRIEEQRRHFTALGVFARRGNRTGQQHQPEDESEGQQHLPGAAQVKILPALMAEPEPEIAQRLIHAEQFAEQTAQRHDDQRGKENVDAFDLALGFAAQHRSEEEAASHVSGRDPEDRQLQMPGAQDVARQQARQVEAVEGARLDAVMRDRAPASTCAGTTAPRSRSISRWRAGSAWDRA